MKKMLVTMAFQICAHPYPQATARTFEKTIKINLEFLFLS
jgi:hypothetical protein